MTLMFPRGFVNIFACSGGFVILKPHNFPWKLNFSFQLHLFFLDASHFLCFCFAIMDHYIVLSFCQIIVFACLNQKGDFKQVNFLHDSYQRVSSVRVINDWKDARNSIIERARFFTFHFSHKKETKKWRPILLWGEKETLQLHDLFFCQIASGIQS